MNAITLQNQNFDLDQAVFIQNDQIKTDSLKVAEIFGKLHKNVIRDIENLIAELPVDLRQLNFELTSKKVEMPNNASRQDKIYEMTKDGFTLLAMGFTGKKALEFKVAYINAFNQMAAMLYNLHNNPDQMHIGAKVQLNSGSPLFTITNFNMDKHGYIKDVEVMWHARNKLNKETLPLQCLTPDQTNIIRNRTLDDFWSKIYDFGLDELNHSDKAQNISLNLTQVYQCLEKLPFKTQLTAALTAGSPHHPQLIFSNHPVKSKITNKTIRCWVFTVSQHVIEHKDIEV